MYHTGLYSLAKSRKFTINTSNNMKTKGMRRALALANLFNLLVAIYFIIISIVSLVLLRWFHRLTITIKVRHIITSATSYFAFIILLFAAIILIIIFVTSIIKLSPKIYISGYGGGSGDVGIGEGQSNGDQETINLKAHRKNENQLATTSSLAQQPRPQSLTTTTREHETAVKQRLDEDDSGGDGIDVYQSDAHNHKIVNNKGALIFRESSTNDLPGQSKGICCTIFLHLVSSVSLIIILVIWLLNTGELVRESISTQLDHAFSKYQFANRSNHYSIAIDGMQDINNCCGSLDYTDFPHQRISQLSIGHYPGSCCGKNIFGVNARVVCTPEEIVRARQTTGCVNVLANYYDLISLLVVPVALASLFVDITIIALITVSASNSFSRESGILSPSRQFTRGPNGRFELKSTV